MQYWGWRQVTALARDGAGRESAYKSDVERRSEALCIMPGWHSAIYGLQRHMVAKAEKNVKRQKHTLLAPFTISLLLLGASEQSKLSNNGWFSNFVLISSGDQVDTQAAAHKWPRRHACHRSQADTSLAIKKICTPRRGHAIKDSVWQRMVGAKAHGL